jgi:uncharacterized peroxidase-related enzyme
MNRITPLDPLTTTGRARPLFDALQSKLGAVPNLFRVLGNGPAALDGYLGLSEALSKGKFDGKLREQIALTVAESNQCGYCLSAHAFIGGRLGLSAKEINDARQARSVDPRIAAILGTARSIVVLRGELNSADLADARAAGLTDGDLIEIVANVALNIFSNYVNHIAGTVIDFPMVQLGGNGAAVSSDR